MGYINTLYKIFRGTTAGDGKGTPARTAAQGINENWDKVDNALEAINNASEKAANKATDLTNPNDTNYPTTKAVSDAIGGMESGANTYTDEQLAAYQPTSEKGAAGGYAGLDANGKVPIANTYNSVEEIVEGTYIDSTTFNDTSGVAVTPGAAKLYVDTTTSKQYRWGGTAYTEIVVAPGTTDAVVEGTTNLYHTADRVRTTLLTGLNTVVEGTITATDSVLSAFGKLQASLSALTILVGAKLDKGTYTGTASDLATLANSKETTLGAQAKADAAEADAKAYAEALLAGSGGGTASTKIIDLSVNWQGGFVIHPNISVLNEGVLETDSRELTHAAAYATLSRRDLLAYNLETSQLELITGDYPATASDPIPDPAPDPLVYLYGPFFTIPAGATAPEGLAGEVIYNGDDTGWTVGENAKWNTQSTNGDPTGTYCLEILEPLVLGAALQFTPDAAKVYQSGDEVALDLSNIVGGGFRLLFLGTSSKNGRPARAYADLPSYSKTATGWQKLSAVVPSGFTDITEMYLVAQEEGMMYYLDNVRYVSGGGAVPVGYATKEELAALDARVTTLEEGGTGSGADVRLSNLAGDLTELEQTKIKTKLGVNEGTIPKEHQIAGVRQDNATVTGTQNLDWNAYSSYNFTLTGATDFADVNLPTGTDTKVATMRLTGDFGFTVPTYWDEIPGDTYDGTMQNKIVIEVINGTSGSEKVEYQIINNPA